MKLMKLSQLTLGAALLASTTVSWANQGVSNDEILVGSILDMSGPLAGFGKQIRNGMLMALDDINEKGIHGRKIRLQIEDDGYDPRKSVLAAQKLVNQDKVFIVAGHLGTAQNEAAMPIQFEKNVINFFPVTAARQMYEPLHRLKYSFAAPYVVQIREWLPVLVKEKSAKRVCSIYQDDDFGLEVHTGGEEALKALKMDWTEKTTFKRGSTDFSSQVARLKAANCDLVVLGTIIRETIGVIGESRKTGFNPTFLGSSAAYTDLIHKLGGKAMDGLYATMATEQPYLDEITNPALLAWGKRYKARFNEDPTVFVAYGYSILDMFAKAAQKTGPRLNTDTFIATMDSMTFPRDMFGSAPSTFSATKRLGNEATRLSQIKNGRWDVVYDYRR